MELIDRRKLLKHLSDWWLSETPSGNREILFINGVPQKTPTMKLIEECIKAVEDQPTAYDIDKVERQLLDKIRHELIHSPDGVYVIDSKHYYDVDIFEAIEIVKKGGVSDEESKG